ncbi:MAG: YceI family protein [Bradymonadia bacterium]
MKEIQTGQIRIFTFKEGLLSSVAHDLELALTDFSVQFNGGDVSAVFNLLSISVLGAVVDGRLSPNTLSKSDRQKIERTMNREVLYTARHPKAELSGELRGGTFRGTLRLNGQTASVDGPVGTENARASGYVDMKPSQWGIKPYSALFGALRLQDRVRVEFWMDLPL